MHESPTDQAILRRGQEEGLRQGRALGAPQLRSWSYGQVEMSPEEKQFRDLLKRKGEFYRRIGQVDGALGEGRRLLFLQGTRRFGQPDAATLAELDAIDCVDHVEAVALRMVDQNVRTWDDLFRPYRAVE